MIILIHWFSNKPVYGCLEIREVIQFSRYFSACDDGVSPATLTYQGCFWRWDQKMKFHTLIPSFLRVFTTISHHHKTTPMLNQDPRTSDEPANFLCIYLNHQKQASQLCIYILYIYIHVHVYIDCRLLRVYIYNYIHTYMYIYTYIYMCVYIYTPFYSH